MSEREAGEPKAIQILRTIPDMLVSLAFDTPATTMREVVAEYDTLRAQLADAKARTDTPDIAALRALHEKATPGPWGWDRSGVWHEESGGPVLDKNEKRKGDVVGIGSVGDDCPRGDNHPRENMELIALMRNALPALLDAASRPERTCEWTYDKHTGLWTTCNGDHCDYAHKGDFCQDCGGAVTTKEGQS